MSSKNQAFKDQPYRVEIRSCSGGVSRLDALDRDFVQSARSPSRYRIAARRVRRPITFFINFRACLKWSLRAVIALVVASILFVVLYGVLPIPMTPLMIIRSVEKTFESEPSLWKKDWVSLEQISSRLQLAAMAGEDSQFLHHDGFDFEAIDKALKHNQYSHRVRGGSTITQQVAKNVFLWPSRSWVRKGCEAYFAALIEFLWSKKRILEVYLNVIEFGDGVYGAEAASQKFFRKPAAKLNSREAALLVAVLPNPRRFSIANPSGYVRRRQSLIEGRMYRVEKPYWLSSGSTARL